MDSLIFELDKNHGNKGDNEEAFSGPFVGSLVGMADFDFEQAQQGQKAVTKRFKQWKPFPKGGKFPLKWSLWVEEFDRQTHRPGMSTSQFANSLAKQGDFENMDQLCRIWNKHTDERGHPFPDSNLLIFLEGINPVWEDPANLLGGHWVCNIINNEKKAEQIWYSLLMTIACGQFPGGYFHEIHGIVISPRAHGFRVYVWNKHSLNEKYNGHMKSFICETLDVPQHWVRYNTHKQKVFINRGPKNKRTPQPRDVTESREQVPDNQNPQVDPPAQEESQEETIPDTTEQEPSPLPPSTPESHEEDHIEPDQPTQSEIPRSITLPKAEPSARSTEPSALSPFSVSVGLAIFLALMYNIYILLA